MLAHPLDCSLVEVEQVGRVLCPYVLAEGFGGAVENNLPELPFLGMAVGPCVNSPVKSLAVHDLNLRAVLSLDAVDQLCPPYLGQAGELPEEAGNCVDV